MVAISRQPRGVIAYGNWDDRKTNFEVIVGRSMPEERDARYVGLVHGYDRKPKRRLFDTLKTRDYRPIRTPAPNTMEMPASRASMLTQSTL